MRCSCILELLWINDIYSQDWIAIKTQGNTRWYSFSWGLSFQVPDLRKRNTSLRQPSYRKKSSYLKSHEYIERKSWHWEQYDLNVGWCRPEMTWKWNCLHAAAQSGNRHCESGKVRRQASALGQSNILLGNIQQKSNISTLTSRNLGLISCTSEGSRSRPRVGGKAEARNPSCSLHSLLWYNSASKRIEIRLQHSDLRWYQCYTWHVEQHTQHRSGHTRWCLVVPSAQLANSPLHSHEDARWK